ncbi:hypothetical protein HZS_6160 [Henneguya salminicola]|nr:hypothetical protein HZS_6160 [Henneguya salminicola]
MTKFDITIYNLYAKQSISTVEVQKLPRKVMQAIKFPIRAMRSFILQKITLKFVRKSLRYINIKLLWMGESRIIESMLITAAGLYFITLASNENSWSAVEIFLVLWIVCATLYLIKLKSMNLFLYVMNK